MSKNTVHTEFGDVEVYPRRARRNSDLEGETVHYNGRFIAVVAPDDDDRWGVLLVGHRILDTPETYPTRIDALTFCAGVGRARYGPSQRKSET